VLFRCTAQHAGDGDTDILSIDENLAAGDGLVIRKDEYLVLLARLELDDRTTAHPQQLLHGQLCTTHDN